MFLTAMMACILPTVSDKPNADKNWSECTRNHGRYIHIWTCVRENFWKCLNGEKRAKYRKASTRTQNCSENTRSKPFFNI